MTFTGSTWLRGPVAPDGLPYHRIQEAGRPGVWRPLVGILLMFLGFALFGVLVATVVFEIAYVVTGHGNVDVARLADLTRPTPAGLAFLNVALATFIPLAMIASRLLHGIAPRWLASVQPRIRWRYLFACLGVALVALIATLIVGSVLPGQDGDVSGHANSFTTTTFHYVLVILFLTPFQAAGEEYLFRGYLTQAFGGLTRGSTIVAVVLPALLFGLAHGLGQSVPVFFDRFAFGLVAGILVIRTGGLEAGIAMHVLNNFLAYGIALAYSDMASTLNPTGGSWWSIPVTLTQSLVYLVLAVAVSRRMRLSTTSSTRVLEASRGSV
ncbi:MAG TPA: type II CAAX endopeptidase family protein [Nocardioides sp.]|uniref:CPBP family intramembrane glutamic endopeptidase n=1 Tax=Nocardioides sp. TaxID=35761 RepID=UPI002F3FAD94